MSTQDFLKTHCATCEKNAVCEYRDLCYNAHKEPKYIDKPVYSVEPNEQNDYSILYFRREYI